LAMDPSTVDLPKRCLFLQLSAYNLHRNLKLLAAAQQTVTVPGLRTKIKSHLAHSQSLCCRHTFPRGFGIRCIVHT
jgi:hypothetical protein